MNLIRDGHEILKAALYGLRSSPKRWEKLRDAKLEEIAIPWENGDVWLQRFSA